MTAQDRVVLLISPDVDFTEQVLAQLARREPQRAGHYQVPIAATLPQARNRLQTLESNGLQPIAIILHDRAVDADAASGPERAGLTAAIRELALSAPVIAVAAAEHSRGLAAASHLIAADRLDCVARTPSAIAVVIALVERRAAGQSARGAEPALNEDFGEALRHEMNNPLTGILGNAELLLARRETLTPYATQRLEIIADLAVRLRETVRRLSNAWQADTTGVNG